MDLAVLFGSASRGQDHAASDIDLFVVTSQIAQVEAALSHAPRIQGVVVSPDRHLQMLAEESSFARETSRGITIMGA